MANHATGHKLSACMQQQEFHIKVGGRGEEGESHVLID